MRNAHGAPVARPDERQHRREPEPSHDPPWRRATPTLVFTQLLLLNHRGLLGWLLQQGRGQRDQPGNCGVFAAYGNARATNCRERTTTWLSRAPTNRLRDRAAGLLRGQLPQHVLQDAAVLVVGDLLRR